MFLLAPRRCLSLPPVTWRAEPPLSAEKLGVQRVNSHVRFGLAAVLVVACAACGSVSTTASVESRQVAVKATDEGTDAGSAAEPVRLATVTCDANGVAVAADIAATRLGVRLRFEHGRGDWAIGWDGGGVGQGGNADADESTDVVWPIPPGKATITCIPPGADDTDPRYEAPVTIHDPGGFWRDGDLDCKNGFSHELSGREVQRKRAAAAVLRELGLQGEVHEAGYHQMAQPVYLVVRKGRVIASVDTLEGETPKRVALDYVSRCD